MKTKILHIAAAIFLMMAVPVFSSCTEGASGEDHIMVEALKWIKGNPHGAQWAEYRTRLVEHLPEWKATDDKTNRYGSLMEEKAPFEATGFFHTAKRDGRWVMVDPEGYMHLNTVVVGIRQGRGERNKQAYAEKFTSAEEWMTVTADSLHYAGFTGAGTWSDDAALQAYNATEPDQVLTYCPILGLMSGYGRYRRITYQMSGHAGFPNQCIPVFDPGFKDYCDQVLPEKLASYVGDPNVIGYFSDNELPFGLKNLEGYLHLPEGDYGRMTAEKWLMEKGISAENITDTEREEFAGIVADRYFSIVAEAIRKVDPDHMYLGSRLHGGAKKRPGVIAACGKYCDVMSINYYGAWEISTEEMQNWEKWGGKPFIITEFYTKAEDSGLGNKTGAGWLVHTQEARGQHYENFTLKLLESSNCVGWHWFKYMDNDPTAKGVDPSNMDSNKGLVNNDYDYYPELLDSMKKVNKSKYGLLYYFNSFLN